MTIDDLNKLSVAIVSARAVLVSCHADGAETLTNTRREVIASRIERLNEAQTLLKDLQAFLTATRH